MLSDCEDLQALIELFPHFAFCNTRSTFKRPTFGASVPHLVPPKGIMQIPPEKSPLFSCTRDNAGLRTPALSCQCRFQIVFSVQLLSCYSLNHLCDTSTRCLPWNIKGVCSEAPTLEFPWPSHRDCECQWSDTCLTEEKEKRNLLRMLLLS